jgi:hypothetical protein
MKIIKFESSHPTTFFAPKWNWIMAEDLSFNNYEKLDAIKKIVLEKEKEILRSTSNQYKSYGVNVDGNTGLGKNSLTSRFPFFNVFSWEEPEIKFIEKYIYEKYVEFLNLINVERKKVWIQCWANVLRKNEEIKKHIHSSHNMTWLGGHFMISCDNTSTFYENPMQVADEPQIYESKNKIGKLTFFQNNLPHYTNKHLSDSERISIAFDIIIDERLNYYQEDRRKNFILFDNP